MPLAIFGEIFTIYSSKMAKNTQFWPIFALFLAKMAIFEFMEIQTSTQYRFSSQQVGRNGQKIEVMGIY